MILKHKQKESGLVKSAIKLSVEEVNEDEYDIKTTNSEAIEDEVFITEKKTPKKSSSIQKESMINVTVNDGTGVNMNNTNVIKTISANNVLPTNVKPEPIIESHFKDPPPLLSKKSFRNDDGVVADKKIIIRSEEKEKDKKREIAKWHAIEQDKNTEKLNNLNLSDDSEDYLKWFGHETHK